MKKLFIFTVVLIILLSSSLAWCATYYVDFDTGADTNNGTTTGTPFKHSPGDDNATNTAASTTLSAGDTVTFKGAVRYKGKIDIDWSGAAGSPITYDGNSAGTWGTGDAVIDNLNDDGNAFYAAVARNYITIKNFEIVDVGGYADDDPVLSQDCGTPVSSPLGGTAISFDSGGTNITIQDSYIHEIGQWRNQEPFEGQNAITGAGIKLQNNTDVLIQNVEFTKMSVPISVKGDGGNTISGITIENVDIHNFIKWGIDIGVRANGVTMQNINIFDSEIHDYAEIDDANWAGCGTDNPHTDGIFIRTDYDSATWSNLNVYNNEFYNVTSSGGGTASIFLSRGITVNIYNNTFINTLHGRTIYVKLGPTAGSSAQVVRIYNNSFYNNHTAINLDSPGSIPIGDVYIKNNIFYDTRATYGNIAIFIEDANSAPTELDYNIYETSELDNKIVRADGIFGSFTLTQLQAYGWELNGLQSDPEYSDISYNFGADSNLNDLRLQLGSPAIDVGTDLSAYLTLDKDGVTRPKGAAWDMGAYEFIIVVAGTTEFSNHLITEWADNQANQWTPIGGTVSQTIPAVYTDQGSIDEELGL